MIISKTPLRLEFVGGGTDLPSFCNREVGACLNTTIDKYIYVMVNNRFDRAFRLAYSKIEITDDIAKIRHELIREALLMLGIRLPDKGGIEIVSVADIHARGTGLGSSGAFMVGLLNSLHKYKGEHISPHELGNEASIIEMDRCNKPVGRQDQFASAYGGFNVYTFDKSDVKCSPIPIQPSILKQLENNLLLFYTHIDRPSTNILHKQSAISSGPKFKILMDMRNLVSLSIKHLVSGNLYEFARCLHNEWMLKKQLVEGISTPELDGYYQLALDNGSVGGKISGCGGGGFLLLYAEPSNHPRIREALNLRELDFKFEPYGSQIM